MKPLLTLITAGLSLALTGCVGISIGGRHAATPPPPPVALPASDYTPAEAATLAEISAAAGLSFESSRLEALDRIARRPDLSPAAQVHLVNSGYRCLSFDNNKAALLQSVIAHPGFCDGARHAIVAQLGSLRFDSNRRAILRALDQRGTLVH